ncbi:MAG: hypothetical protein KKF12_06605 [Proteobacteria bacterium]|nr:hypothetical protein [Pseudomonadota bacterium]MBU4130471.1 hypothetical protein [Pseudomonadota bacterium]
MAQTTTKESRQNWARLIQKIYEVDLLICPKCRDQVHITGLMSDLDFVCLFA